MPYNIRRPAILVNESCSPKWQIQNNHPCFYGANHDSCAKWLKACPILPCLTMLWLSFAVDDQQSAQEKFLLANNQRPWQNVLNSEYGSKCSSMLTDIVIANSCDY
jgi:hypothetical protein